MPVSPVLSENGSGVPQDAERIRRPIERRVRRGQGPTRERGCLGCSPQEIGSVFEIKRFGEWPEHFAKSRVHPRDRASSTAAGVRSHASGMERRTIPVAKLKNVAATTEGPTRPTGALRPAK